MKRNNSYELSIGGHKFAEALTLFDLNITDIASETEVPEDVLVNWAKGSCIPTRYIANVVYDYIWNRSLTRDLLFLERCVEPVNGTDIFAELKAGSNGSLVKLADLLIQSDDEKIKMSQAYAIASKKINPDGRHWYRMREILGGKCKKTLSDAGGIKIGSKDFSIILPNGYGDGITRYAVLVHSTFNNLMFDYKTSIAGNCINIYDYDCGNRVLETLSGEFHVYSCNGIVVFEDMNKA